MCAYLSAYVSEKQQLLQEFLNVCTQAVFVNISSAVVPANRHNRGQHMTKTLIYE